MLELLTADLTTITVGGLGLSTFLMFATQALKGLIPDKYIGFKVFVPFLLGLIAGFAIFPISSFSSFFVTILGGLFIGLLTTGEYRMFNPVK
jgi:hypothetical protein